MINVAAAITPFLSTQTVKRIPITYDANNRPVQGTPTTFTSIGSMQEATGKDLKLLPEGEYTEEVFVYFTKDSLYSGLDDGTLTPDQVNFYGQWYKIILKDNWNLYGYYRYLMTKLDVAAV